MIRNWPKVPLGLIAPVVRRPVSVVPDGEYLELGIRSFGKGTFHKPAISGVEVGNKRLFRIEPGDLLLSNVFAWEGAVAVAQARDVGRVGSHRFITCLVDRAKALPEFLCRYLLTSEGIDQIRRASPGGAGRNRTLGLEKLSGIQLPLPPLIEQHRIVAQIEALEARILEAQQLRESAIHDTEALWSRCAARLLDAAVEKYPIASLSDHVSVRGGGTPSKANPAYWDGSIPWITPKDMKRKDLSDAIDHISIQATRETPAKLIAPGAVLVVVRGMILAHTFPAAVLKCNAAINQDMKALVPDDRLMPEYLCSLLWGYNRQIIKCVEKSTHDTRKLDVARIIATKIPIPPVEVQARIVADLNALQEHVDALRRVQIDSRAELDALFPAVIHKTFVGDRIDSQVEGLAHV